MFTVPGNPLFKWKLGLSVSQKLNDMPVVYQSRAVTEPQREVARRSRDGGVAGTNYGNSFISPVGGAKSPQGDSLYAYPARESLWSPNGVAKIMQGAKPVRLAAEAAFLG